MFINSNTRYRRLGSRRNGCMCFGKKDDDEDEEDIEESLKDRKKEVYIKIHVAKARGVSTRKLEQQLNNIEGMLSKIQEARDTKLMAKFTVLTRDKIVDILEKLDVEDVRQATEDVNEKLEDLKEVDEAETLEIVQSMPDVVLKEVVKPKKQRQLIKEI